MAAKGTQRSRRRLTPLIALLGVAALMAAATMWLYSSSSPAKADSGPQLQDVDGFYLVPNSDGTWAYVRLDYMMGPGTSAADGAAQAQADAAARFPGAIALDGSGVSAAYVLSGFKWTAGTTSWSYDATGAPSGLTGASVALNAAAATWGAAGANFHYTGGGPSSNGTGSCGGGTDGFNTIGWAAQSGSILAVTCSRFTSGGAAVEFDMQIDPAWAWTTGPSPTVDLQSVVTHEMGHALGLGHSPDPTAVMYFAYTQGTLKRSLAPDDVAGEIAIYGGTGGGGASPTPSPSPSNTPTNTPTPTKTPTKTPTQQGGSATPSNTPTATPTSGATNTPTPTPTQGAASTPTPTTQGSPSATATATATMTPSPTPSPTQTPTPTVTATGTGPQGTLPLLPGANLLTWPGATASPGTALAGELGAIRIIYQWDPATQTWLRYGPGLPSFVNTLTTLTQGKPYWFIATSAAQVPFVP